MKAIVGAFNQEKAPAGALSVIVKTSWTFVSRNGPSRRGFNLDQVNLAHSQITSIEHITMNPGPELYMEYYSEYDFPTDNYDHIGDIGELVSRQTHGSHVLKLVGRLIG